MKKRRVKSGPSREKPKHQFKKSFSQKTDGATSDFADSDVDSDDIYHDEIDDFHADREKLLLGDDKNFSAYISSGEEEVLPITDDDDDEDHEEGEGGEDEEFEDEETPHAVHKSDMESDVEEKSDDDLPNLEAWGKKKSTYYSADFVDKDRGKSYREEDLEKAEAEETGALEVQTSFGGRNLYQNIFGLSAFRVEKEPASEVELNAVAQTPGELAKEEKLKLLEQDSPEFFLLADDFKELMKDLIERISPLVELVKDGRIQGSAADYVTLKYNLVLHYCMNISFYMMLKSQGTTVKYHPVMKRASAYKKLLNQLEPMDQKLRSEIDIIVGRQKKGEDIEFNDAELQSEPEKSPKIIFREEEKSPKIIFREAEKSPFDRYDSLKLPMLKRLIEEQRSEIANKAKKQKVNVPFETEAEKEVSSFYTDMKKKQMDAKLLLSSDEEEEHQEKQEGEEMEYDEDNGFEESENDEEVADEKRTVTYEIAKNKGLLPYRKKEYRNPRVRNRMKFRRAKIRRKGQVREPRKELTRYGGELTGIRTDVARSIRLQ